jgi:hypothetical protein
MPAAIGAAIARMLATIEPWVRSFIEAPRERPHRILAAAELL